MVWQAKGSIGAELVNEPGTLTWNELATTDVDGAKEFYGSVFGWQTSSMEGAPMEYAIWHPGGAEPKQGPDGNGVGGLMSNDNMPEGTPPFWGVYFAVEDADATAAKVEELGGTVVNPPFDAPGVGRIAALNDPQGALFMVIAPARQD
jgi:predicted enzyme related to lactoylglutathione lyase